MRVFATVIGPSTYAFAAVLTGIVSGLALGAACGSALTGRVRRPEFPLALALGTAAVLATWTSAYAGSGFAQSVVRAYASSPESFGALLLGHAMRVAALVAPAAVALGVAFPLALEIAGPRDEGAPRRLGAVYAINTIASVAGSLTAGFIAIPRLGLQTTLGVASAMLVAAAVVVVARGTMSRASRVVALAPTLAALALLVARSPWDRELLAGGGYKYAARVPRDLDLETALKAGTLVYYREGAAGIVTVKRLTGELSLAIDGKVDASTGGDMLTQKTLAHLPLLIHGRPRLVCIIGLGSGVTLASALVHPIASVDVVEISPEVVAASSAFAAENSKALDDARAHLLLGDGRTHLSLSDRQYDVIISEPSNPWMAGVAALFTREFFLAARSRLAPNGIICQWAHTYDISEADLRSIVATFASVFPNGTMWLVGDGDLLLVGSAEPLDGRLSNIASGWRLPGVAADLDRVSMRDPFALWSLYVGGPRELQAFGGAAALQTDNRMAIEFSGPAAVNNGPTAGNTAALRRLLEGGQPPPAIASALATADSRQWRDRAAMMLATDAYDIAYQDYATTVRRDRTDRDALSSFVRAAVASHHEADGVSLLKSFIATDPTDVRSRTALSKLQAAAGAFDEAIAVAEEASRIEPVDSAALDQLASLYADLGDAGRLDPVVDTLQRRFGGRSTTRYYAAASNFLHGRLPAALDLIQQVIASDPRRADAYNMLGAISARLGQPNEARRAFEAGLDLNPRDSAAYTNLGLLELSSGNRSRAAKLFAEALSLDPASAAAREGLGQSRDPHP